MGDWDSLFEAEVRAAVDGDAQPSAHKPYKTGRPKGTVGGGNFWRNVRQQSELHSADEESGPTPGSIEYARACLQKKIQEKQRQDAETGALQGFRPAERKDDAKTGALQGFGPAASLDLLGSSLQHKTYEAMKLASTDGAILVDEGEKEDEFVNFHISGDHQLAMSGKAQKTFWKNTSHPERRLHSIASAILQLCGFLWGAFLTMLCNMGQPFGLDATTESGEHKLFNRILSAFKLRYDETPTKVRVVDPHAINMDSKANQPIDPGALSSASLQAKILQVELSMGVLFQDGKGRYCWVRSKFPTSLYALDSTSGENIHHCLADCLRVIPDFQRTSQTFKMSVRHSCTDRAPANYKAERLLGNDYSWMWHVHTACDVHRLSTATQVAMTSVGFDTSGILSVGLAMQDLGAASGLQQVLAKILARSLVVHHAVPPQDDCIEQYREQLFDLFLPLKGVQKARAWRNRKRRFIIAWFLNGRLWDKHEVSHFCPWGCCCSCEETVRLTSTYLVWAIAPHRCPKYVRSRWTRYDESVDFLGLLGGIHGLLEPALSELWGSPHTNVPIANAAVQERQESEWDALQ